MDSHDIFIGECVIFKNRVTYNRYDKALLRFDGDIREFKLMWHGEIQIRFPYTEIKGTNNDKAGLVIKKQLITISLAFPDGNEYALQFQTSDFGSFERLIWAINRTTSEQEAEKEIIRQLKSRERVSFKEVCGILKKHGLPDGLGDGRNHIETLITKGVADGILDGEGFVSKTTLQRETVNYNVAASFDFKDGVLQIKCPNCGASIPLKNKEPTGKCQFCGATYAIPTKILQLI